MVPLFAKTIGHAGKPVPVNWMTDPGWQNRLGSVVFPKYPRSVTRGSRLVYYAAGRRCFCAVMEAAADAPVQNTDENPENRARWPWELPLRLLVGIPADATAPTLEAVQFSPLRIRRQSHIRLTDDEYRRITDAILAAAAGNVALPSEQRQVA